MIWRKAPRTGSLFTFSRVHKSHVTGAGDQAPYTVAYVEVFAGGPRILTNIKHDVELTIGQMVMLDFVESNGRVLPVYCAWKDRKEV
jgi:uncharacterized OB-fold protein